MVNLLTAIMTKITTGPSAFSADCSGQVFLDQAPEGTPFPYSVFFIVSGTPDKTFTEHYTDTLIQFSLFSASEGVAEITGMYADLKALFDECSLSITSSTLVWMRENSLQTMFEDITTPEGTVGCRHWACDYEIKTSLQ